MTSFMIQLFALVAGFSTAVFTASAEKPNIVLIIADDLGYGELGFQGCTEIPTPHIDSIAKNGTRFTDCLLYTSPSPRDGLLSRMPSSA